MIRADVAPGVLPDTKIREIQAWLDRQTFDPEVDIRFRGTTEEQEESIDFLSKAFSFALLLMFALLVTQFNSIYQSFLIMLAIVLSHGRGVPGDGHHQPAVQRDSERRGRGVAGGNRGEQTTSC